MTTSRFDKDHSPIGVYRNTKANRWFEVRGHIVYSIDPMDDEGPKAITPYLLNVCDNFYQALDCQKEFLKEKNVTSVWIVACDMVRWEDRDVLCG